MNRHFEDAWYYMKRAAETARKGVEKELEPAVERLRKLTGRDAEPEPGRLETIKADLQDVRYEAESEAREVVADAREKIDDYRGKQTL